MAKHFVSRGYLFLTVELCIDRQSRTGQGRGHLKPCCSAVTERQMSRSVTDRLALSRPIADNADGSHEASHRRWSDFSKWLMFDRPGDVPYPGASAESWGSTKACKPSRHIPLATTPRRQGRRPRWSCSPFFQRPGFSSLCRSPSGSPRRRVGQPFRSPTVRASSRRRRSWRSG